MNPYQYDVICSVCGGPAVAKTPASWFGKNEFIHDDYRICKLYLNAKKQIVVRVEEEPDNFASNMF